MQIESRRVLSREALRREKGVDFGNTQLDVLIKREGFPVPFLLGGRKRFWYEAEVDAWIAAKAEARAA
jgi:predicted DNA-binding transcriptional regulator AlpA